MAMRPFIYAAESGVTGEGDNTEVEVLETALESTAEQGKIQAETAAIDTEFDEANAGLQAADDIQAVVEVASDSLENGEGLNEQAAEMAVVAIESAMMRLTGSKRQRIVMAVESFGSSNSRVAATESIVQGGIDLIKRVWQNIKEFAKRIWDRIKQLFGRIVNNSKLNGKNIDNLRNRINQLDPQAEMDRDTLKSESLAKKISIGKNADEGTYTKLAANAKELNGFGRTLAAKRNDFAAKMNEVMSAALKNDASGASKILQEQAKTMEDFLASPGLPRADGFTFTREKKKDNQTDTAFGPFVGNLALVTSITRVTGSTDNVGAHISTAFERADKDTASEAKALDRGAMKKVLDEAAGVNEAIGQAKGVFDGIEKVNKTIEKSIDQLLSQVSKEFGKESGFTPGGTAVNPIGNGKTKEEARQIMTKLQQDTKESINMINMIGTKSTSVMNDTVLAGIDYVQAALGNFKTKK